MRKSAIFVTFTLTAIVFGMWAFRNRSGHTLELNAVFADVKSIHVNAPVRIAGVTVGSVTAVRAYPADRANAVEITMTLKTAHDLQIPSDSRVSLATDGLLGETYPVIDVRGTTGRPVANGAVLKSQISGPPSEVR